MEITGEPEIVCKFREDRFSLGSPQIIAIYLKKILLLANSRILNCKPKYIIDKFLNFIFLN